MSRHKKINKTKKLTKKQTRGESIFSSDDDRSSRSSCRSRRSSFTSTSALSTPPRPFSRASKFDTTNKFPQIRVRKTRWEPLPEEIQRPKEVKKRTKSKNELIRDFHKEKDHFRPLLDFIDDRKQMAAELLDSIDVRTRNKIFPELKEKNIFECRMIVYHFLRGMTRKRITAVMQGEALSDISSTTESEDIDNAISSPSCSTDSRANSIIEYGKENSKKSNGNRKNNQSKKKVRRKKKKMEEELEEGEVRSSQEEERMKESSERSSSDYNEDDDGQHDKDTEEMKNVEPEPKQQTGERTQQKLQDEPNFVISLNFSMPFTRESAECSSDDREEKDDGVDKFGQQRVICILPPSPPLLVNGVDESAEESREGLTSTPSPSDILLVNNSDGEESGTEDKQRYPSLSTDENQAEDEEMEEGELGEEEEEKETGRSQSIISDEGEKITKATTHSVVPTDDRVSEEEIEEPDIELVDE